MANRVFLAFANPEDKPLPYLSEEDRKVHSLFVPLEKENYINLSRESHAALEELSESLGFNEDELMLFHFSGHAGSDFLVVEDGKASAEGILQYLAKAHHLRLVFLNGCSTCGQVQALLNLNKKLLVIATNTSVDDELAKIFSVRFYKSLCTLGKTVEEAFEDASKRILLQDAAANIVRGLQLDALSSKQKTWALFSRNENLILWKLPSVSMVVKPKEFQTNKKLIERLLLAYAKYKDEELVIRQIKDDRRRTYTAREILEAEKTAPFDKSFKEDAILAPLPYPISEQLRKLITEERENSEHTYFTRIGRPRLQQLLITHRTIIEFIAFVLISDLWNFLLERKEVKWSKNELTELQYFLSLSLKKRSTYSFIQLIEEIRAFLDKHHAPYFVSDLKTLPSFEDSLDKFGAANIYLSEKNIQLKQIEDAAIHEACIKAEQQLTVVLTSLSFLIKYSMCGIRTVEAHKLRFRKKPSFKHRIVKIYQPLARSERLKEDREELIGGILDTASVYLVKLDENSKLTYLSLSPFIIDANAFDIKVASSEKIEEVINLYAFNIYDSEAGFFYYKIYKPDEIFEVFDNKNEHIYSSVKELFDEFMKLLSNQL